MRINLTSRGIHLVLMLLLYALHSNSVIAQSSSHDVRGTVQNNNGEPLPGVSVIIKNTKTNYTSGTSTDSSGNFTFTRVALGGPYSFTFSTIGYEPQTVPGYNIRDDKPLSLSVRMKPNIASLDQVVVVGYGTARRKDLTGSIGSIGSRDIEDLPVTRVDQALSGKIAGVQVQSVSGQPGAAPRIRIRGVGSISAGGSPLYVVDGYPTEDIQMINPNDIETIDVLKDASATAIYGSRGANGVLIINTKRGKAGKSVISFDAYTGWQKVLRTPEFLTKEEQANYYYYGVRNQNIDAGKDVTGDPLKWANAVPKTIMDVLDGKNAVNVDPYDAIFTVAPQQSYNLSARGGNELVRYMVNGEYLNQDGIITPSNFKRYSFRANVDAQLSKRLAMKLNLNTAYTTNNDLVASGGGGGGEGVIGAASTWEYWYPLYNDDGSYFNGFGQDATNNVWNPMAIANEIKRRGDQTRTLGNLSAEYKFTDDLKLNVMLGGSSSNSHYYSFIPKLDVFANVAEGTDERSSSLNWITETTLNYNKNFGKHSVSGLLGYTTQKQTNGGNFVRSRNYPNNLVYTLNATSNIIFQGNSSESEWSLISYLSRINYNYNSKYYLTASMRADGSSRFGQDKRYGYFPSSALAWRVSNEDFLIDNKIISDLKLRVSYGETGNNNIGNYAQYATIGYESYPFGGTALGGIAPTQLPNPTLTWEKQRSSNFGVDAGILKNRISFSADYFKTINHNLLLNVFVPLTTGFNTSLVNIGEVENNGWDFTVNTRNLVGKSNWSTNFNISTFKNKVTKLGPEGAPIISAYNITQIGEPIGMFYGYITDGVFKNKTELDAGPIFNPGASDKSRIGDIRFKDISGPAGKPDGVINSYDRTIMGSPYPDYYYGMTNNFGYKNISLSISVQGSQGNQVYSNNDNYLYTRARYKQLSSVKNYWKSETEPGDGESPRPNNAPTGGLREKSTRFLDDGSFFRINNINLSYSFADQIARKLSISSLRAYVTATYPLLVTKYKFFNPEVSNSGNPLTPGVEDYNYPLAKSLIVGLNVSF
jgi:TonB-linked SusC/RagA family outer membrane protein